MTKENENTNNSKPMAHDALLAAVNSVFPRFNLKKYLGKTRFVWKTAREKYYITICEPERYNFNTLGKHICRIDTRDNDHIYCVEPERLLNWLKWAKKELEAKRRLHKEQVQAWENEDFEKADKIELELFINSSF